MGAGTSESSFGDEQLRVLVEHRLTRGQQCALLIRTAIPPGLHQPEFSHHALLNQSFSLVSPCHTHLVKHVLSSPVKDRHGDTEILDGVRVGEPSGWWGAAVPDVKEETEETEFVLCELKRVTAGVSFLLSLYLEDAEKTKRLFREVCSDSMRRCGSNL